MRKRIAPAFVALTLAACAAAAQAPAHREGQRLPATVDRPDIIFRNHCSVCHGEKGNGDSFARHAMDPPPVDFTSEDAKKELSRAKMLEAVRDGALHDGRATAMQSFTGRLTDRHVEMVVDYIIVTFMGGKLQPDDAPSSGQHGKEAHARVRFKPADWPFGLVPDAARGKGLYETLCVKCHGVRGDGQGPQPPVGARPRDFRAADFREFANGFTMFSAISRGNAHMPAFGRALANQDVADVAAYVLEAFVPAKPGASAK